MNKRKFKIITAVFFLVLVSAVFLLISPKKIKADSINNDWYMTNEKTYLAPYQFFSFDYGSDMFIINGYNYNLIQYMNNISSINLESYDLYITNIDTGTYEYTNIKIKAFDSCFRYDDGDTVKLVLKFKYGNNQDIYMLWHLDVYYYEYSNFYITTNYTNSYYITTLSYLPFIVVNDYTKLNTNNSDIDWLMKFFMPVNFEWTTRTSETITEILANPHRYGLKTQEDIDSAVQIALNNADSGISSYSNIMTTIFNSITSVLNTQIFPGITIGLIIGLPLLLGAFLIIIKIVRG